MQKIKAKITGRRVHDIGYRVLLVNKALSFGVDNFNTFNTYLDGIQAVIVIIEADDETMENFKSFVVSVRPEKSIVDEVSFEEYRNSVPPIERVLQVFQIEQWGKGIPILMKMLDTQEKMLGNQESMLDKQDSMLDKQDSMLDKQDSMLDKQDSMLDKQDSMLDKQDSMLNKQDVITDLQKETIFTIKTEGEKTRDIISTRFSQDVADLRQEISHIKSTIAKMASKVGVEV